MLSAKPNFPRNIVDFVIKFIYEFIKYTFCKSLETSIINIVTDANCKPEVATKLRQCFTAHCRIFENFETENDRFALLKSKDFQEPVEYEVQTIVVEEIQDEKPVFVQKTIFAVRVSLIYSFKNFFEIPQLAKKL